MAAPDLRSRPDVGLSHVALTAANLDTSLDFYARYAGMEAIHRRGQPGREVVWLSDGSRHFVLVLLEDATVAVGDSAAEAIIDHCQGSGDTLPWTNKVVAWLDPSSLGLIQSEALQVTLSVCDAAGTPATIPIGKLHVDVEHPDAPDVDTRRPRYRAPLGHPGSLGAWRFGRGRRAHSHRRRS